MLQVTNVNQGPPSQKRPIPKPRPRRNLPLSQSPLINTAAAQPQSVTAGSAPPAGDDTTATPAGDTIANNLLQDTGGARPKTTVSVIRVSACNACPILVNLLDIYKMIDGVLISSSTLFIVLFVLKCS